MSTYRIVVSAAVLVTMAVAGCAHKPHAPPAAAPQAGEPATIANPTSPDGIRALSKRLTLHLHALYSITEGKYSYFAGESLVAEYEVATEILRISSLTPGQADLVCVYSPQGVLYIDPKAHSVGKTFAADCNQLVTNLNDDLSH